MGTLYCWIVGYSSIRWLVQDGLSFHLMTTVAGFVVLVQKQKILFGIIMASIFSDTQACGPMSKKCLPM